MVGEEGLEPSSLSTADFKSTAYTIPPLAHLLFTVAKTDV
jgi:hypothetical protein